MDHWSQQHTGRSFDDAGAWAASGRMIEPLLAAMLADPYFAVPPPKSTGRDHFNPQWLQGRLHQHGASERPVDVQATLAELTASVCSSDIRLHAPDTSEV